MCSAALTRNEAKSMSTRLLAGESFAIFQIKAELSFAFTKNSHCWSICGDFDGQIKQRPSRIPLYGICFFAAKAGISLLHVEVAAAGSLSALSQIEPQGGKLDGKLTLLPKSFNIKASLFFPLLLTKNTVIPMITLKQKSNVN